jgi:hypothetical protein
LHAEEGVVNMGEPRGDFGADGRDLLAQKRDVLQPPAEAWLLMRPHETLEGAAKVSCGARIRASASWASATGSVSPAARVWRMRVPDFPRVSLMTLASLMLASSRVFGIRLASAASSRNSRCGRGGMARAFKTSIRSSAAIHWLSWTSVFRPGIPRICWGFTTGTA